MFQECKMIPKYLTLPCYILHIIPRCRPVYLDVCGVFYATGT